MERYSKSVVFIFMLLMFLGIPSLRAYWADDGVTICSATDYQQHPQIISDGAGGAVITWQDRRIGSWDIYARRIDAGGNVQWTANGAAISTVIGSQEYPQIASDGAGGAIITWRDYRSSNYDIYTQRINASGNVQWTADGVAICTATDDQYNQQIIPDGAGGAVITWQDYRSGSWDIYAQRMDAGGNVQWTAFGVAICMATGDQNNPQIIPDGAGGAVITWQDRRSGTNDIYAQCIDASGYVQWTADGVAVCTALETQSSPQIISDGAGGAVITWQDFRSGSNDDIYVQRIDTGGSVQWTADGVAICTATGDQEYPQITSDGAGGAVITWQDRRSGTNDIYARRIDAGGNVQWTSNGVAMCTATNDQEYPQITSDGAGGAVITWQDRRSGTNDIYARRIDAGGNVQWTSNGVAICTATGYQERPQITSDGAGGAVITWHDNRSGSDDIYAQQINRNGRIGYFPPEIHSVLDVPGDEGGWVNIAWDASICDPTGGEITHYTIWRALSTQAAMAMLDGGAVLLTGTKQTAPETDRPVVRKELLCGQTYYWELIDSHNAYYMEGYSKIVATAFDSSAATSDYHYFQVIAHTSDPMRFYVSAPDSGYSVDNLAPCPPLCLAGKQSYAPEGLTLTWNPNTEPDLDTYAIYRGLSGDFVPAPVNLIASPCDTIYFDGDWHWDGGYYYKVSALDVHGNESPFALLSPEDVTGEDVPETPRADFLSQNFPNPFNPQTKIVFGIREAADVSLKIYDTSGRLVSVLVEEIREAGRYEEIWDGRSIGGRAVASGVYFYRLDAGAFAETKKMVLMR